MSPLLSERSFTHLAQERRAMELERPLPQPITPEAKPYWDGLREQKLMLPRCHASDIEWFQASGRGKLFSFEIGYQTFNKAFKVKPPFVLAMIELEEGPRMMSNLIGIEPDPKKIRCDMPVEVVFEKQTDEITLPLFRPAGGAR